MDPFTGLVSTGSCATTSTTLRTRARWPLVTTWSDGSRAPLTMLAERSSFATLASRMFGKAATEGAEGEGHRDGRDDEGVEHRQAGLDFAVRAGSRLDMANSFSGVWKNQRKSTLTLAVNNNGKVTGKFDSGVGDDGQVLEVAVEGRVLGDVITFNVLYEKFGTVVTWVGQLTEEDGAPVIETSWLHASNIADDEEADELWSAVRTGADTFRRA